MDGIINFIIDKTWKSEYFRAAVLAQVRGWAATAAGAMAVHGYISNDIAQQIIGVAAALAVYYLQNLDVKLVDGKIKFALHTYPPVTDLTGNTIKTVTIETKELPDITPLGKEK